MKAEGLRRSQFHSSIIFFSSSGASMHYNCYHTKTSCGQKEKLICSSQSINYEQLITFLSFIVAASFLTASRGKEGSVGATKVDKTTVSALDYTDIPLSQIRKVFFFVSSYYCSCTPKVYQNNCRFWRYASNTFFF